MKLIIFTTCKPFINDDAWRQEQAIKSWTMLEGMDKIIIVMGNDKGTKEICQKYNIIHEPEVKNLYGVPYLHAMFEIAIKYADKEDYLFWTNSDMIYYNDIIKNILAFDTFKNHKQINNFALVGGRLDWHNPKILNDLSQKHFISNVNTNNRSTTDVCQLNSSKYECSHHKLCGIDYVIHSPTTFINRIDKNLVIAGTRHDLILVGTSITNKFYTCNITNTAFVIHQNHGYKFGKHGSSKLCVNVLIPNNTKCTGVLANIYEAPYQSQYDDNGEIVFN
jgi:hypothetical protein